MSKRAETLQRQYLEQLQAGIKPPDPNAKKEVVTAGRNIMLFTAGSKHCLRIYPIPKVYQGPSWNEIKQILKK